MISVSIVVPIYGKKDIFPLLKKYKKELEWNGIEYEIIVVNEGGEKKEFLKLKKIRGVKVVWNGKRKGKGWAVRKGFSIAKKEIIGFVDGDNSISPKELIRIIKKAKEKGCAIGKRTGGRKTVIRQVLSKIFNIYVGMITGLEFDDTQCGIKFFKKEKIKRILKKMKIDGFAFDVEILYLLKRNNERIVQVPIKSRDKEKSTLSFLLIIQMLFDVLRIRLFH